MHKCLLVPEILSMVFTHLRDIPVTSDAESSLTLTLVSLSISCKAFTEIALDVLWRDIGSLSPLADCLPVGVVEDPNGIIVVERAVELQDFVVFQKYARRVHSVGFRGWGRSKLEPHVRRILSNFPCEQGGGLLPNLKEIVWRGDDDESISFFRLLVPRTLVSLHLKGSSWHHGKLSLVSLLHKHFPNLEEFRCLDTRAPPIALDRISQFVCNSEKLSALSVGPLSEKAMVHLTQSTELSIFGVELPKHDHWDRVTGTFFPNLSSFRIRGSLAKVAEYLADLRLSPRKARFKFSLVAPEASFEMFSNCITKSFDHQKLLSLEYVVEPNLVLEFPASALNALFKFKNLTNLLLENVYTPHLNDEQVIQIANHWPSLHQLKIGTRQEWDMDQGTVVPEMTLYGVAYVAQRCKRLQVLGLVFDSVGRPTASVPEHWTNPEILIFSVGESTCSIKSAARVARLVAQVFPRLDTLENLKEQTRSPPPGSRTVAWRLVKSILKGYTKIRDLTRREAMKEAREEMYKELEQSGFHLGTLGGSSGEVEREDVSLGMDDEESRES